MIPAVLPVLFPLLATAATDPDRHFAPAAVTHAAPGVSPVASPWSTNVEQQARVPDSLRVPILVYHNIQSAAEGRAVRGADLTMRPEVFAAQMQYLKAHQIPVVSFTALVEALEGKRTLPPRAVVITFDDGRVNQLQNAVPLLRKLGFTATFFPFTHAMDRNPRYFTWAQLRELQKEGFTIGSHTSLHVRVDKMKDARQMHEEVTGSREALQKNLGTSATEYFSYPFGALAAAGDSATRTAGYRAARAYTGGPWNSIQNRWRLKAVPMTENMKRFVQVVDPESAEARAGATRAARPAGKR
ncbi:MAG: polysaccharide deacetylase family protein [Gemmatimonadaceae bacterium]|nr:polysaccharide deacetylase family protein [Gemmatimonadaceae bacterium]